MWAIRIESSQLVACAAGGVGWDQLSQRECWQIGERSPEMQWTRNLLPFNLPEVLANRVITDTAIRNAPTF